MEPNDYLPAHVRLFHSSHAQTIALGDSHMAYGFVPSRDAVNLAFPGETIEDISHKAFSYLSTRRVTRAVVQADAHMFSAYRANTEADYKALFDRTFDDTRAATIRTLSGYHRPKLFAYWRVWLLKGSFDARARFHESGWIESADHWELVDERIRQTIARDRAKLQDPIDDFAQQKAALAYAALLARLVKAGVNTCIVEFPVSDEYYNHEDIPKIAAVRHWFAAEAVRLGIRYNSYHREFRNQPQFFSDSDHLSSAGAAAFSEKVVRDCFE
ncbi:MAG: hypothetical protein M3Z54_14060 [Gemmatimonadota bacterium]|nr:hypothetical protein [Gemmatimonadota bacterium]